MRPKITTAVLLFISLTALTAFSEKTEITRFAAFGAYSSLSSPSLNLTQRGFDGDFGWNYESWLTLGFDFSTFTGHTSLYPSDLSQSVQARLIPFLPLSRRDPYWPSPITRRPRPMREDRNSIIAISNI